MSFKEFLRRREEDELEENSLRRMSPDARFAQIVRLSKRIHRTDDLNEKLDLMADLITQVAALKLKR